MEATQKNKSNASRQSDFVIAFIPVADADVFHQLHQPGPARLSLSSPSD